jgi:RNA polymerase sigma-70 factor (ECF subfamily)
MADDFPGTVDGVEDHWQHQEMFRYLNELSDDHRMILSLRFVSGLSPKESAQVLNRSEGATRALQFRALAALRALIEQE